MILPAITSEFNTGIPLVIDLEISAEITIGFTPEIAQGIYPGALVKVLTDIAYEISLGIPLIIMPVISPEIPLGIF